MRSHIFRKDPAFDLRAGDIAETVEEGTVLITSVVGGFAYGHYGPALYEWDAKTGRVSSGPRRDGPDIRSIIGGSTRLALSFR